MTIKQATELIPDIEAFKKELCNACVANDWYCPSDCDCLKKAQRMDFERILKSYARNDGDLKKVIRFIYQARI